MAGKPPPRRGQRAAVAQYLIEHPNVEVHRAHIARALGMSESQVSGAISSLKGELHLEPIGLQVWRYTPGAPAKAAASAIYSQVGVAGNGDHIIEDESGKLYRAVPL